MNQFGQMNMQLSPMGPRQTPPLQHPGQLSQAGAMNQVSARFLWPGHRARGIAALGCAALNTGKGN